MTDRCPACGSTALETFYGGERGEAGPFVRCLGDDGACGWNSEECRPAPTSESLAQRVQAALAEIGWTSGTMSMVLEVNARSGRRWASGTEAMPPHLLAWLERLAALHRSTPPPARETTP